MTSIKNHIFVWKCTIVLFGFFAIGNAQNSPKIQVKVDKQTIKIGEQIKYELSVENSENKTITFPEGQTFSPLEMVSSQAVDTFRQQEKQRLVKNYFLTQFDSGVYTIPKQRILIDNLPFETDSLRIQVQNVAVDTLKQPLFNIKPIISVNKPKTNLLWWWILGGTLLLIILFAVYWFFFRKKKLSEQEKINQLPAYDRAILGLKNLQNSKYLLESKHKQYYSELTDIVRRYLEEEIHISATESTTDELITKLELLLESEKLNLSKETISDFKRVLQKADLVKFAKSQPQDYEAETDRQTIEGVVVKTKKALPRLTEEEKMQDEDYRIQAQEKKRKRRRISIIITSIYILFYCALAVGGWLWYRQNFASTAVQEYLSKEDWVTSVYGDPPLKITTPEVLQRKQSGIIPNGVGFVMGNALVDDFTMAITSQKSTITKEQLSPEAINSIVESVKESTHKQFNAQNILSKDEFYTTPQGVEALKIFGSFDREVSKGQFIKMGYQNYIFINPKNICFISFFYLKEDEMASELLIQRILNSMEFVSE